MADSASDLKFIEGTKKWLVEAFGMDYASPDQIKPFFDRGVLPLRPLSNEIMAELREIKDSEYPFIESPLKAGRAIHDSGKVWDPVLFVSDVIYFDYWDLDSAKQFVPSNALARIERTRMQMPPRIAKKVYSFGESGMGYTTFELVMRDGKKISCYYQGVSELVQLPSPYEPDDILDVVPLHRLPRPTDLRPPASHWCIYPESPEVVRLCGPRLPGFKPERHLELRPTSG